MFQIIVCIYSSLIDQNVIVNPSNPIWSKRVQLIDSSCEDSSHRIWWAFLNDSAYAFIARGSWYDLIRDVKWSIKCNVADIRRSIIFASMHDTFLARSCFKRIFLVFYSKRKTVNHARIYSYHCTYLTVSCRLISFRLDTLIGSNMTSTNRFKKSYVLWFKNEETLLKRLRSQNPNATLLILIEIFNDNINSSRKRSLTFVIMKLKQIKRFSNAVIIRLDFKKKKQNQRAECTISSWMQNRVSHSLLIRRKVTAHILNHSNIFSWIWVITSNDDESS